MLGGMSLPPPVSPRSIPLALLLLAAAGAGGSLALTLALGLRACPLCFYQRAFALAALAALVLGRKAAGAEARLLGLHLALATALGGLGVALWHVSLEVRGVLECPSGLLGLGTAPQQSLAFFVVLVAAIGAALRGRAPNPPWTALALGAVLAACSLVANPPLPAAPTKAYDEPPLICRPPYRTP